MRKLDNGMLFWHVPSEKGMCTWPRARGAHGLSMCMSRKDPGKKTDWDFKVEGLSYCENKSG